MKSVIRIQHVHDKVDFVKLQKALGAAKKSYGDTGRIQRSFQGGLAMREPVVIDCQIDVDDKVWPMVTPGASIEDAFDEEDLEKLIFHMNGEKKNEQSVQLFSRTGSISRKCLKEAAEEMLDYKGCGMSVMEMSHRSKDV